MAEKVSVSQVNVLRGADQQQTTKRTRNLLYEGPTERLLGYTQPRIRATAAEAIPADVAHLEPATQQVITRSQKGLRIQRFELHNRGGANTVGIGFRLANEVWEMGEVDVSATAPYTRITNYQSRTQVVFGADYTEVDNDFIVILSRKKWNWVSMNVTQATSGGANVSTVGYSNEAGTGWIIPAVGAGGIEFQDDFTNSSAEIGAGEAIWAWNPAHDWGKIEDNGTLFDQGLPAGFYAWRILFTTVPNTNDLGVTGVEIGTMKWSGEALADNGLFENEEMNWVEFDADGVVAYFGGANVGNSVDFEASHAG